MNTANYGKGTNVGEHITNPSKFSQPVLFDGIGKGKVMPTDYDGVIEIDNHYWFAFEVKQKGKSMPYGQSLAYTRTADKWRQCGDIAIVFIVEHSQNDSNKPILLKDCLMTKYYQDGKWCNAKKPIKVSVLMEKLKKHYKINKI